MKKSIFGIIALATVFAFTFAGLGGGARKSNEEAYEANFASQGYSPHGFSHEWYEQPRGFDALLPSRTRSMTGWVPIRPWLGSASRDAFPMPLISPGPTVS